MKKGVLAILASLALVGLVFSSGIGQSQMTEMTIAGTAQTNGNFTSLVDALNATDLSTTLNGSEPFTVFAPTDNAFAQLNQTMLNYLLTNDTANLTKLLQYHVVPGLVQLSNLTSNTTLKTVEGSYLRVTVSNAVAENETVSAQNTSVNMTEQNATFMVNGASVIMPGIPCTNGIIYATDAVLMPPKSILETADAEGNFTTLVAALNAANMTETLNGTGAFTVFAPTDDAFAALNMTTLDNLFSNDTVNLTKVLQFHVVPGYVFSDNLSNGMNLTTLEGSNLTVTVNSTGIFVDGAMIVVSDILCSNGVIHIIDTVLMPTSVEEAK